MARVREDARLWKWGLAAVMMSGAILLTAAQSVRARQITAPDMDCYLAIGRACHIEYYPMCHEKPEGTTCYECPDIYYAYARCLYRPEYTCVPSEEQPFNCGKRIWGICIDGECWGSSEGEEFCTMLQCLAYPT